jgi:cytochrome c oxidase cbb3-type subunit 3
MGAVVAYVSLLALPLVVAAAQTSEPIPPLSTATTSDIAAGKRVFASQCAWCHGTDGAGGTGPDLVRPTLRHAANDRSLVDIVHNGIPGTEMPSFTFALTHRTAWQTAAYVKSLGNTVTRQLSGDPRRGAALYETAGCGTCHIIAGRGQGIGPELTAIGALRGPAHLRESVVDPGAGHPPGYLVVRAVTNGGKDIRGVRLNEDVFWIHIRDASGTVHVLQKSDLSLLQRELQATLMPSYATRFSAAELDDLIAYLASLRGL